MTHESPASLAAVLMHDLLNHKPNDRYLGTLEGKDREAWLVYTAFRQGFEAGVKQERSCWMQWNEAALNVLEKLADRSCLGARDYDTLARALQKEEP